LVLRQVLAEPAPPELQSEEQIGQIAKEARIPVMTGDADDIDDLAGVCMSACGCQPAHVHAECMSQFLLNELQMRSWIKMRWKIYSMT